MNEFFGKVLYKNRLYINIKRLLIKIVVDGTERGLAHVLIKLRSSDPKNLTSYKLSLLQNETET